MVAVFKNSKTFTIKSFVVVSFNICNRICQKFYRFIILTAKLGKFRKAASIAYRRPGNSGCMKHERQELNAKR